MAQGDTVFVENGILPAAHFDLLAVDPAGAKGPRTSIGQIAWSRDKLGALRLFTYRQNVKGSAFAAGDLASRSLEVETNITAGSTTSATGTWNGADDHVGGLFIVHDDAGAAGAAPEGEFSVVSANTATVVTLDANLPLSAALAVNDDVTILSPGLINSAANDPGFKVAGVVMGAIADNGFGWVQFQGLHPAAKHAATAMISGDALKAGTAVVEAFGTVTAVVGGTAGTGVGYVIGYQVAIHGLDSVSTKSPVVMSLLPYYM